LNALKQNDKLTPKRKAFVKAYLATGGKNATQAAIAAGFSNKGNGASVIACRLLQDPVIQQAIKEEATRRLRAGVALGATTLEELALNAQSESVRLQAAQALLDRGGMQLASLSEHHVVVKDERSDDELRARVLQLQRELGLNAKVIPGEVVQPLSLLAPVIDAEGDIFQ
jgi:hypothetical protein